jgi:hypothetical protein
VPHRAFFASACTKSSPDCSSFRYSAPSFNIPRPNFRLSAPKIDLTAPCVDIPRLRAVFRASSRYSTPEDRHSTPQPRVTAPKSHYSAPQRGIPHRISVFPRLRSAGLLHPATFRAAFEYSAPKSARIAPRHKRQGCFGRLEDFNAGMFGSWGDWPLWHKAYALWEKWDSGWNGMKLEMREECGRPRSRGRPRFPNACRLPNCGLWQLHLAATMLRVLAAPPA